MILEGLMEGYYREMGGWSRIWNFWDDIEMGRNRAHYGQRSPSGQV